MLGCIIRKIPADDGTVEGPSGLGGPSGRWNQFIRRVVEPAC